MTYQVNKTDIVFVISDLGSGGAQKILVQLLNHFSSNYKVSLITLDGTDQDFYKVPDHVERIALNLTNQSSNFFEAISANYKRVKIIRQIIKQRSPKTVLSFIGPTNTLCIIACMFLKLRLVISERNDPARQSHGKFWDFLRKRLYRFADLITANSPNATESMKSYVPNDKLRFIPNGLELPKLISLSSQLHNKKILHVGRLHEQKAQDILLQAFDRVLLKHPNAHLTIVGEGSLKKSLENLSDKLGISKNVTFTGRISNVENCYQTHPIFVLPSRYEGTPNALLEAISYGCAPLITETCEGALEFIKHEYSGLIIPVDNIDALAHNICRLLEDDELKLEIGKKARQSVERLDNDIIFRQWESALMPG